MVELIIFIFLRNDNKINIGALSLSSKRLCWCCWTKLDGRQKNWSAHLQKRLLPRLLTLAIKTTDASTRDIEYFLFYKINRLDLNAEKKNIFFTQPAIVDEL